MAQRFEGRNIDEALTSAAEALGVERYRLLYHVVLEKRGFLGGMKRVVIEAEVNEQAPEQVVAEAEAPASGPPVAHRERGGRGGGGGRGDRRGGRGGRDRERGNGGRRDDGRRERGGQRSRGRREEEPIDIPMEEPPEQGPESEPATSVRQWCDEVFRLGGFELALRTTENDQQIVVKLYGRDARRMLERNGELLDAVQVLVNKALVGRKVEKDIELDCAAFKERRVEEIGQQARATADRVRRDGREQLLPAMSPIERRIVHLTLQDDADVTTESRGDGFYKRVAIKRRTQEPTPAES